jgi:hypothetical protein
MNEEVTGLLAKAERSITAASTLLRAGDADFAASRAHYAMFYTAEALLLSRDLTFSKHTGVHAAFGRHFEVRRARSEVPPLAPRGFHRSRSATFPSLNISLWCSRLHAGPPTPVPHDSEAGMITVSAHRARAALLLPLALLELPDYGEPVTIRHLVHHTSGLRDMYVLMSLAGHRIEDVFTDEEALALIARKGAQLPAGH